MAADTGMNVLLAVIDYAMPEAKQLREEATMLRARAEECEQRAMALEELHAIAARHAPPVRRVKPAA